MFSTIIKGEKIILRPYKEKDVTSWQIWDIDPGVQLFMPEPANKVLSVEEELEYLNGCQREEDAIYWSVVWRETDLLIGSISLTDINEHHGIADLGIVIGEKDYWGRGVATEAIKILLEFLPQLKLRRITAELEEGNDGLIKALERNSFKKECVCEASRIKNGKPINTIRYVRFI